MILNDNSLLSNGRGKLNDVVVKKYGDKYVLSGKPDMSRRKLSPKQKERNERMDIAIRAAKHLTKDPETKQRACELLDVPANKVFRAIVSWYLRSDGTTDLFEETEQETQDKKTLKELQTIITAEIPGTELFLFGERTKNFSRKHDHWDLLVLTKDDQPPLRKWEVQERLFAAVIGLGQHVNILLVQKDKWENAPEYAALRGRIEPELIPVKI